MQNSKNTTKTITWVALLVISSAVLSYVFACVTPFSALATIAALTLSRTTGLWLVITSWVLNQVTGYTLLDYPADSFAWGIAIGISAALSFFIATGVVNSFKSTANIITVCTTTLLASFATYQITLFIASLLLGSAENFSLDIEMQVLSINILAFTALLAANWLNKMSGFFPLPQTRIFSEAS